MLAIMNQLTETVRLLVEDIADLKSLTASKEQKKEAAIADFREEIRALQEKNVWFQRERENHRSQLQYVLGEGGGIPTHPG